MPDLEISNLPPLTGTALQGTDPLPLTDLSASATKKITAKDLIQNGVQLIDAGSIPTSKVNLVLPAGSVGTAELANGSVTAIKMADGSSGIVQAGPLPSGTFQGQLGVDLTDDKFYVWDGGSWHPVAGAASVNAVTGNASGLVLITATQSGDSVEVQGALAATGAANEFLAGPSTGPGSISQRKIVNTDLPVATATDTGIVAPGSGLTVNGTGVLSVDNTVAPQGARSLVTYDANGLVTGGSPIAYTDLPVAAAGRLGAIYPGPSLAVDPTGQLLIDNAVVGGTQPKITFNAQGLVTGGQALDATDVPSLDASKITTGEIDIARIADRSLTNPKFADYSTVLIQEAEPSGTDYYTGQFWYQESTAQLRTWSGNSWIPVGFGRLSEENLRFCGTFDASTGNVDQITTFGSAAGLAPGAPIPAASDTLTGAYLVATTPGTYNGQVYDNGDWTLCLGQAQGWQRVDTLSGAGTTTIKLADLLDTTITTPASGDTLIFDGVTGKWINKPTAAQKATFVETLDGNRTTFTLSRDADSANNLLISLGGIIQEPGVDFTFTAPRTVNFAGPPPAGIDYWIVIEGVTSTGGGGGGGTTLPDGTAAEEYLRWSSALGSWQPADTLDGGAF